MGTRRSSAVAWLVALFGATACGGASPAAASAIVPAASAPPATDLIARVANPTDFHISYRTDYQAAGPRTPNSSAYVKRQWSGTGEVVLGPKLKAALHETNTFCFDLCPIDEFVDGTDRYAKGPDSSWSVDRQIALDTYYWSAILPSNLRQATAVRVVGEQRLDGVQTWVVDALMTNGQPFRVWLSQDRGYAVRLTSSPNAKTPYLDIQIDATGFDRGIDISAPAKKELFPLYWGTEIRLEQPIPLGHGSVTIHVLIRNCHGGAELQDSLDSGFFIQVPLTYTAAAEPIAIDPGAWHIYGEFGHQYDAQPAETTNGLVAQSVRPGGSVSGDMCFFLPFNEDRFALVGDLPGGTVTSFVGGVLLPDSSGQASPAGG